MFRVNLLPHHPPTLAPLDVAVRVAVVACLIARELPPYPPSPSPEHSSPVAPDSLASSDAPVTVDWVARWWAALVPVQSAAQKIRTMAAASSVGTVDAVGFSLGRAPPRAA